MGSWQKYFEQIRQNPRNVRFSDLCKLAEKFGFRLRGGKGSHRVYTRKGVFEIINFQNVGGMIKPYQVRRFISIIDKYDLKMED